jgi:hypothetical protein
MLQTLLQKRANGYSYFRWVCPPVIRKLLEKREVIQSLRAALKIQALARAGSFCLAFDKIKALAIELQLKCDSALVDGQEEG